MKKIVLFLTLLFAVVVVPLLAQPLDSLVAIVTNPPKVSDASSVVAYFQAWSTYVAAIIVLLTVYVAQWIPGLANILSYLKPYFRAITVGVAALLVLIFYRQVDGGQASWAFILSNLGYELLKALFKPPTTLSQEAYEARQELSKLPI